MSERTVLSKDKISSQALKAISNFHPDIVRVVMETVAQDRVVVVGMKQNPVVKQARQLLDQQNIRYTYLEYGSYFSMWKERLAIKLWSGWPTYPQIFVNSTLIGGLADLREEVASGELQKRLQK
ncbi:MAG: glutaredoxin domain-containing protein [Pseudomonadota bacterium]